MKTTRFTLWVLFTSLTLLLSASGISATARVAYLPGPRPAESRDVPSSPEASEATASVNSSLDLPPDRARVSTALSSPSPMFIENVGQFAEDARFQVRGGDRTIWLAEDTIWVTVLEKPSSPRPPSPNLGEGGVALPSPEIGRPPDEGRWAGREGESRKGVNIKLSFVGANPHPRLEPFNRLDAHVSYLIGNDPGNWRADVPVWGGVRYVDLYPGIDLEIANENGQWHWQMATRDASPLALVGRGAGSEGVRLQVEGVDAIALDGDRLRLTTGVGEFSLPLLQVADATLTHPIITGNQVALPFTSASPNLQSPILNPQSGVSDLPYATFLGGSSDDSGLGITLDGSGMAYVTGYTLSSNFPTTPGTFDTTYNGGYDVFVVKLNAAGSALAYATFLGGSNDDSGSGIAVDGSGAAYVTGQTRSSDFPTSPGAFDTNFNGGNDAFVVKLSAAGSALAYATFLGGSSDDQAWGIAVDGSGAAYVTGNTGSDFPTTPGAFDTTYNGGNWDAFVVKLNAAGSALAYATFLVLLRDFILLRDFKVIHS